MTMLHEQKPSLEEALEHYGVKGMKWGVRRSEHELAKARIRDGGSKPSRGGGKRAAANMGRSGKEIHKSRAAVKKQKAKITAAAKKVADAKPGPAQEAAKKTLQKETKTLLSSNDYPISAQMSVGEAITIGFFGTPLTAVSAWTAARANSQRRSNIRSNIILGDAVMEKEYQQLLKLEKMSDSEAQRFIEKDEIERSKRKSK